MRDVRHDNLAQFMGACVDNPNICILFQYCAKGSLQVIHLIPLRWLKIVFSTYIWMGPYNYSLSLDATIMVSKHCPIIGEHVVIIFVTQ